VQPWLTQNDWDAVLGEVRRTIDRWFFWVSVTGVIYVTPKCRPLNVSDLADMIRRLLIICDDSFPKLIAFEFSDSFLETKQWAEAWALLRQFSAEINATMLPTSQNGSGTLILLHRHVTCGNGDAAVTPALLQAYEPSTGLLAS